MKLMYIENNKSNKNIVRILRVAMFLAAIFKSFYMVDGFYNDGGMFNITMNGIAAYVGFIVVGGLLSFVFALLCSTAGFGMLTKSKFAPIKSDGVCAVNYCTYHTLFSIAIIVGYVIQGALGLVMYFYPISLSFLSKVAFKLVAVLMVVLYMALLSKAVPKGQFKHLFVGMLFPNIIAILLLG